MDKQDLFKLKNTILNWLMKEQMFFTVSLMGCVEITLSDKVPVAGIGYCSYSKVFRMLLNPVVFGYDQITQLFVFLHELRHVAQVANAVDTLEQIGWGRPNLSVANKHRICNIAADIALNQDVATLLKGSKNFASEENVVEHVRGVIGGGCFVDDLIKEGLGKGVTIERARDYVYYAHKILEMAENSGSGEGDDDGDLRGFDVHDFGEGAGEGEEAQAVAKAALEKATQDAAKMARNIGAEAADHLTNIAGKVETTREIRSLIKSIKIKAGVAGRMGGETKKTWGRKNRKRALVPGRRQVDVPVPGVVLVLDTSGSMYDESMLRALVGVGQELVKQKKLAAAYCCDTELYPLSFGKVSAMKGGGGTVFNNTHIEKIREEHAVEKLVVMYVTDGYVDLTEARRHKDVELIVVDLPSALKKST
jgi:predicted metal-dependent peptidase